MVTNKKSVMPLPHERFNAKINLVISVVFLIIFAIIILKLTGII